MLRGNSLKCQVALAQAIQRSCGCPIPEGVQSQVGWGSGQSDLQGVGVRWSLRSLWHKQFCSIFCDSILVQRMFTLWKEKKSYPWKTLWLAIALMFTLIFVLFLECSLREKKKEIVEQWESQTYRDGRQFPIEYFESSSVWELCIIDHLVSLGGRSQVHQREIKTHTCKSKGWYQ